MDGRELRERIRTYLLQELVAPEDAGSLDDTTPLMTSGILDSLATLNLISFLRQELGVRIKAHEIDAETLDTVEDIAALVEKRRR